MMKDFMTSQQRHEEESKRQKEMHDQKMELFKSLLSALKDGKNESFTVLNSLISYKAFLLFIVHPRISLFILYTDHYYFQV